MADLLGGLTVLGHIFNKRSDKEHMENNMDNIVKNSRFKENTSGKNIFDNNQMINNINNMKSMAKNRFNKSAKSGMIRRGFNRTKNIPRKVNAKIENYSDDDSIFSDQASLDSMYSNQSKNDVNFFNPVHFLDKSRKFEDITDQVKPAPKVLTNDSYSSQFDSMTFDNPTIPVGNGGLPHVSGNNAGTKRYEMDRNLALNKGFSFFGDGEDMTFNIVDKEHFTHTNMIPQFKSKGTGNFYNSEHRGMQNQRKMELFTGAYNRPDYRTGKEERTPLFSPLVGMTNIYGMPALNGVFETRYNPARERRNEKPFEPIKITPGLGLGAYKQRTTGYVEPVRILPKTVDDIRPLSKPKITYEGRVVDGQKGSRGPIIGREHKKKPLRYRETPLLTHFHKTFGNNHLNPPRINGKIEVQNLATMNRGTKTSTRQYGPAKFSVDIVEPAKQYGLAEQSKKENYLHAEPFNVHLVDGLKSYPTSEPWIPKMTQRGKELNYLGPLGGNNEHQNNYAYDPVGWTPDMTLREVHAETDRAGFISNVERSKNKTIDYTDIPDLTNRELYAEKDRAGNIGNTNRNLNKVIDFSDVPDLTNRELYAEKDRAGNIGNTNRNLNKVIDFSDVPDLTNRELYAEKDRAGNIGNTNRNLNKVIDFSDVPDLTNRELYAEKDRAGNIGNTNRNLNKVIDFSDVPDITNRELYAEKDRAGNIGNTNRNLNKVIDFSDVPDLTNRELYAEKDRAGNIGNTNRNLNKVIDYSDVPDLTNRELYAEKDRAGNIGNTNRNLNKVIDFSDVPDMTLRELVGETNHYKPARAADDVYAQRSRHDANNSLVNNTRELISQKRSPTYISQDMGYTTDFTEYRMNTNKIIDNKRINFQNDIPSTNNRIRFEGTHVPKIKWFFNNNEDRQLLRKNIDSNPHINNIVHKAEKTEKYNLEFDNKFKIL